MAKTEIPDPGPLKADSFVDVVDANGNLLPDPVPEHWIGTDLVAPGVKKAPRGAREKQSSGTGAGSGGGGGPEVPAKSASKEDWVAYAVSQGAAEADANAATKEQLIDQYGGS